MSKIEKIKNHLKEHKREYLIGGSCLVGGVLIGAMVKRPIYIQANAALPPTTVNVNTPVNNNIPVHNNIRLDNSVAMGGYTSKIVKNMNTGELYGSVSDAAAAAGVSLTTMSKHINGKTDHVYGDIYEIIGFTKSA